MTLNKISNGWILNRVSLVSEAGLDQLSLNHRSSGQSIQYFKIVSEDYRDVGTQDNFQVSFQSQKNLMIVNYNCRVIPYLKMAYL